MERNIIPGGEWIFFKIYTGHKMIEHIIVNNILPFIELIGNNGYMKKFFFIRYYDPKYHLRLRIKCSNPKYIGQILLQFYESINNLVQEGVISSIKLDTYEREIERYGATSMEITEDIFHIDSVAQLSVIRELYRKDKESDDLRWRISLIIVDDILDAFSYKLQDKFTLIKLMADNYKREFDFTTSSYTKQLNNLYRTNRRLVEDTLKLNIDWNIKQILKDRKIALQHEASKIYLLQSNEIFSPKLQYYISSLVHMSMNRLFRTRNRLCEMVIYEMLSKYYLSEISKNSINKS